MRKTERQAMADKLVVKVYENPDEGLCSITEWFKSEHDCGIEVIDTLNVDYIENAERDGIKVIDTTTDKVIIDIKGQKALVLSIYVNSLIEHLGIKIR